MNYKFKDCDRKATEGLVQHWDPYPFILISVIFSAQAAYAAPVIMMSQNRQAAKDRMQADLDYQINLKAELEVAQLHHKMDTIYAGMQAHFAKLEKLEQKTVTGV